MVKRTRRPPRIGLVVGLCCDLARKADGAVDEAMQPLAPGRRHARTILQPRMQIRR
jgi:hypothetical protein